MNTKNTITLSELTKASVLAGPVRVRVKGIMTPRVFVVELIPASDLPWSKDKFRVTEVQGPTTDHCETIRDVKGYIRCHGR